MELEEIVIAFLISVVAGLFVTFVVKSKSSKVKQTKGNNMQAGENNTQIVINTPPSQKVD